MQSVIYLSISLGICMTGRTLASCESILCQMSTRVCHFSGPAFRNIYTTRVGAVHVYLRGKLN